MAPSGRGPAPRLLRHRDGNVKEYGISAIERLGPYELAGDPAVMALLDDLLSAFLPRSA